MAGVNKVIFLGNLGANPELRFTQAGNPVCNFRMASHRTFGKDKTKETTWMPIVVWGKLGESCSEYLSKGREVYVEGRISNRKWKDKEGNTRYTTEIVATNVQFLGGGRQTDLPAPTGTEDETPPEVTDSDLPY